MIWMFYQTTCLPEPVIYPGCGDYYLDDLFLGGFNKTLVRKSLSRQKMSLDLKKEFIQAWLFIEK